MLKQQAKGRTEEPKAKVNAVAGKVVENMSPKQTGITQKGSQKESGENNAVAGDDKKSAKSPSALKAQSGCGLVTMSFRGVCCNLL